MTLPSIAPGISLFNPKQLGSSVVLAWYRADSFGGSDGDAVGTWSDSSGNSRDMTQGTAGKKPTYKTNIRNGKPIMRFDGGDTMTTGTQFINKANKITMFFVGEQTTVSDNTIIANSVTGAGDIWRFRTNGGTQELRIVSSGNVYDIATGIGATNWAYYTVIIRGTTGASGTITMRANGSDLGTSGSLSRAGSAEGNVYIGSNIDVNSYFTGDIAEILFCDGELTALQYTQIESYLKMKYAL